MVHEAINIRFFYFWKNSNFPFFAHFLLFCSELMFWPVFIIATLATVVGSQAIISATFSIISQCRALRCFPRVKIVHTSSQVHGQIYIPEVNWILMGLCIAVAIGFRDISMIGHAYGLCLLLSLLIVCASLSVSWFHCCLICRSCCDHCNVCHNLFDVSHY